MSAAHLDTSPREILRVFVPGTPKGQPRPRAFARAGKARVYDPGTAEGWKSQIALAVPFPRQACEGPVSVFMQFVFARPKSHTRSSGALKDGVPNVVTSKPDIDNLAKAVLDALTGVGVWNDDAQVTDIVCSKRYALAGERPGCHLAIAEDHS